jgi:peroxisomal 3,2-trans-enoyl-CoA isomerase
MASHVTFRKHGAFARITFNNPSKKNAISPEMYDLLSKGLKKAHNDPDVIFTVFTGTGDFYSSGNEFNAKQIERILNNPNGAEQKFATFVEELIQHDKVLIALVNGPAIGIACTTLALFDLVIASDKAYFYCPFTQIGLSAEGSSSYTFPQIMGHQKAAQLAIFAEKLSAKEALSCGFIAKVIPDRDFRSQADVMLEQYGKLAPQSVLVTKSLLRTPEMKKKLMEVNKRESDALRQRWLSDETVEYMSRRFLRPKV